MCIVAALQCNAAIMFYTQNIWGFALTFVYDALETSYDTFIFLELLTAFSPSASLFPLRSLMLPRIFEFALCMG